MRRIITTIFVWLFILSALVVLLDVLGVPLVNHTMGTLTLELRASPWEGFVLLSSLLGVIAYVLRITARTPNAPGSE